MLILFQGEGLDQDTAFRRSIDTNTEWGLPPKIRKTTYDVGMQGLLYTGKKKSPPQLKPDEIPPHAQA